MARLSACFATFVCFYCSTFAFGAPEGAKANDLQTLDLQVQSVKVVLTGTSIVEALNQMAKRLDKVSPALPTISCPKCPERATNITCPDLPHNGNNLEDQVNMTCPECPAEVTTVSCPEPVKCPACPEPSTCSDELTSLPVDCYEYRKRGFMKSGIYKIYPLDYSIDVYCDMETDGGGWTVFQRRGDFGEPKQDFYLNWTDYKKGFGDLKREFWLGNDYLFALTNQKGVSIRIDLEDWEGEKRYAVYQDFLVRSEEDKYRVTFRKYSGNAGDSLASCHNRFFSTKDRDNDIWKAVHCAQKWKAGWWFRACTVANLNGLYLRGSVPKNTTSMIWPTWKGSWYSLKRSEMKIRPIQPSPASH